MGHIAGISDEVNSISELHKQVGRRSEKKLEPLIVRKALMELIDPLVQQKIVWLLDNTGKRMNERSNAMFVAVKEPG